jgi:hypothetical protein
MADETTIPITQNESANAAKKAYATPMLLDLDMLKNTEGKTAPTPIEATPSIGS